MWTVALPKTQQNHKHPSEHYPVQPKPSGKRDALVLKTRTRKMGAHSRLTTKIVCGCALCAALHTYASISLQDFFFISKQSTTRGQLLLFQVRGLNEIVHDKCTLMSRSVAKRQDVVEGKINLICSMCNARPLDALNYNTHHSHTTASSGLHDTGTQKCRNNNGLSSQQII